ncbi:ABC-three component system protein [Chryseobacterium sp. PTM-20240506]|uniref:ABC-three component system protein n=1 Tax=Chryseobacterium sp. PTM-20240506 TaxID=3400631 RepID=UPI00293CD044|nr:hypothetical protein [Elizabethkingia anophelis]
MTENDIKKYSVILGEGSGALFQPADSDKTYVLSARHVFYDEIKDERGRKKNEVKKEITLRFADSQNEEKVIEIKNGENYFEHFESSIDAAILLLPDIVGYNQIFTDSYTSSNGYNMAGFPESRRASDDKYNKYKISDIISSDQNVLSLRLEVAHLSHSDISGFSGGGIIKFNDDYLTICGIQSRTPEEDCNGEISVVPIMRFIEITRQHNLPELLPSFLVNFKFLKQSAFNFDAGIDDEDISFTRLFLKQKTEEVLSSDITPRFIKDYFTDRLLINEKDMLKLNDELIYITWLEFLTLINIVKDKACNISDLEDIFCYLRLLYRKTDTDWLETDFLKDCLVSNYDGLEENGTVFIKTNKPPIKSNIKHYKLDKGSIIPRIDSLKSNYENGTLNSDVNNITNALSELKEFVFEKYNFIHFEYLKHFMLVENSENYKTFKKSNENELLIKLKEEYGKVFGI